MNLNFFFPQTAQFDASINLFCLVLLVLELLFAAFFTTDIIRFHCFYIVAQPGIMRGRGGFLKKGNFDKCFMYDITKKSPAWKNFGVFFSKILLKLHFKWNLTHRCTQTGHFLWKIRALFFYFQKKAGETLPALPPLVARLLYSLLYCAPDFFFHLVIFC